MIKVIKFLENAIVFQDFANCCYTIPKNLAGLFQSHPKRHSHPSEKQEELINDNVSSFAGVLRGNISLSFFTFNSNGKGLRNRYATEMFRQSPDKEEYG